MSLNQIESYPTQASPPLRPTMGHSGAYWATVLAWLAAFVAACMALGPLLIIYGRQLWGAEHYQFVPILLLAAAWLAWTRWKSLPEHRTLPHSMAARLVGWGCALLLTAGAAVTASPMLSVVALLTLALAGLYEWRGTPGMRHFLPVLGVLLLAVRPPFGWDQRLILSMQRIATQWGSGLLDLIGMRHMSDGVVIRMPEQEFFVAEACSGVHSLFAALAFIAVYSAATHRGILRVICLLTVAVFWVLVANILRVVAVVVLSTRFHLPVLDGPGHEALGIAVFAVVVLLVMSTDRLLLYIAPLRASMPNLVTADTGQDPAWQLSTRRFGRAVWAGAVAVCFIGVAVGMQQLTPRTAHAETGSPYAPAKGLVEVPEDVLPARWNGWERVNFEFRENEHDLQGEFSRIWNYRKGRLRAAISIDGPFAEWHDTELCYEGLGYVTQSREDHFIGGGQQSGGYTELSIAGGRDRQGYVLFMAYTESGKALSPPATRHASIARLMGIWRDRLAGASDNDPLIARVFQVQILSEGNLPYSEAEKTELQEMFHEMRGRIAAYVSKSGNHADAGSEIAAVE